MATESMTGSNESSSAPRVDPIEHATSLYAARQWVLYDVAVDTNQRAVFMLGWATCAEVVRRERGLEERAKREAPCVVNVSMPMDGSAEMGASIGKALSDYHAGQKAPPAKKTSRKARKRKAVR